MICARSGSGWSAMGATSWSSSSGLNVTFDASWPATGSGGDSSMHTRIQATIWRTVLMATTSSDSWGGLFRDTSRRAIGLWSYLPIGRGPHGADEAAVEQVLEQVAVFPAHGERVRGQHLARALIAGGIERHAYPALEEPAERLEHAAVQRFEALVSEHLREARGSRGADLRDGPVATPVEVDLKGL